MDLASMAYTHLFWGILLVPLIGLDGTQGPCPTLCHCSLDVINCSSITRPPGFNQVSFPKPADHPFTYLDFTDNAISSIGKEVWNAFPWAESLVLKNNSLRILQSSSLEGLLLLTYLDLSHNEIQIIDRNAFEVVPFLQVINLSGNIIEQITEGTFQAWHGMQFLLKVDLSHNPLAVIQDSYFYRLPLLMLLDLGATKVTLRILEDLLQNSLQLRTLIFPKKMSCCLCHIKDTEVLHETVKLECTESCDTGATLCEKEEPLNQMQEVMKILEIRKQNGSSLLSILPEKAVSKNETLKRAETDNDTVVMVPSYSSLAANLNLLKMVKQLMQVKVDELLDMKWADKREFKKLYLVTSLLQAALKEKIVELDKVDPEATIQNELPDQLFRQQTDEPRPADSRRKVAGGLDTQRALPFLIPRQVALQSFWKHSFSDSPMNALEPTGFTEVDNDDNDLTSLPNGENSVLVLKKVLGSQILTKEELLNPHLHKSRRIGDGKPEISAGDSEPSLNELSPQRTSVSPPLGFLAPQDNKWIQDELFDTELNKKLTSLIPNTPVRNLISHIIHILKIDCTASTLQMACAKLISRTDLLMKLLSKNVNKTSSLWPPMDVANMTTAGSRKLEKSFSRTTNQAIPAYEYGNKVLLAISLSAIILTIIALILIFLIEICPQCSAAKNKTFLGKGKKHLPDEELPRTPSMLRDKPLWLKSCIKIRMEYRKTTLWTKNLWRKWMWPARAMQNPSSVPTLRLLIPLIQPPPPPLLSSTPSQKSTEKKSSDSVEGTSEVTNSKSASSTVDEGSGKQREFC